MPNHERSITRSEELRKKKISFKPRKSVLIVLLLLVTSYLYQIKPVFSSTIHVPAQYQTIQAAVDNAAIGDTVQVAPGIYYEHVNVNRSVTIVGENPQTTIVDGTANGTIFDLDGSNIKISGFTIRNAGNTGNAITSSKETITSDNHWISNNIITTSQYGVYLSYSTSNRIFSNTFINNVFAGISVNSAGSTNITANTIVGGAYGIKTTSSTNNIIVGNTISQSSYSIYLASASTGNTVRNNVLSGKTACVYSSSDSTTIDHNALIDGATGIYLYNAHSGSIYYNTCKNSSYGIRLYNPSALTSSHTVSNNKILYTDWAIELVYSDGNTLTGNWLQQNTYGVYMSSSSSNTFYRNNFVNNKMQASAGTGSNAWSKSIQGKNQGNYWSDYTGADANGDGIGDTPYRIAPIGADNYPLMTTWSEHDIEIKSVTPSTNQVNAGATINITVTVKNRANTSISETFTVTTKYNSTIIATQTVSNLAQGATQTLTFNWDTTGVASGNYTIKAEASIVPDELYTDNNKLTDGTVKVTIIHDIAVRTVTNSRTIGYAGYGNIYIQVDVKNEGAVTETFDVTVYRNSTTIETQTTTVDPGANKTLTFTWDLSAATASYYNILATAGPVAGELDLSDNSLNGNAIRLRIPGDVNGDRTVDILDVSDISAHWYPGPPIGPSGYDATVDINNDGSIDIVDVAIVSANWGRTET